MISIKFFIYFMSNIISYMISSSFTMRIEVAAFIGFCTRFKRDPGLQMREKLPKPAVYLLYKRAGAVPERDRTVTFACLS